MPPFGRLALALLPPLAACATVPPSGVERVTVRELVDHPERWIGREVEVRGLAVHEFENFNLYADYRHYCGESGERALGVAWSDESLPAGRNRSRVIVRGTFRNRFGRQPDGLIRVSTGMSTGPLENPVIVRYLSRPYPPCRR